MTDSADADELAELISRSIFAEFLRSADRWAQLDVTMPQLKVLLLLRLHGSSPVSALAHLMKVSPPNVTGILDRLEAHHWIRRIGDPHDRRVVRAILAPEGERLIQGLEEASISRTRERLDDMDPDDRRALSRGLRALLGETFAAPRLEPVLAGRGT